MWECLGYMQALRKWKMPLLCAVVLSKKTGHSFSRLALAQLLCHVLPCYCCTSVFSSQKHVGQSVICLLVTPWLLEEPFLNCQSTHRNGGSIMTIHKMPFSFSGIHKISVSSAPLRVSGSLKSILFSRFQMQA